MDSTGSFNRIIPPTRPSVVKNSISNSGQPNTSNSGRCPLHKNECAEHENINTNVPFINSVMSNSLRQYQISSCAAHSNNQCACVQNKPICDRPEIEQREQNTPEHKPLGLNSFRLATDSINSNDSDHKVTRPINNADETSTSNVFKQNSSSPCAGTETANRANDETHSHANETRVHTRCHTDCQNDITENKRRVRQQAVVQATCQTFKDSHSLPNIISHDNVPRGNINPGEMALPSNSVEENVHVSIDMAPFISTLLETTRNNLHHAQNTLAHLERQIQVIDNVFNSASSNISVNFTRANEMPILTSVEQSCPRNTANRDTVANITQNSYVRKPLNKDTENNLRSVNLTHHANVKPSEVPSCDKCTTRPSTLTDCSTSIMRSNETLSNPSTSQTHVQDLTHEINDLSSMKTESAAVGNIHCAASSTVLSGYAESKPAALQTSNLDSNKDDEVIIIPHSGFTEIIIDLDSDSEDNSKNRGRKLLTIIHPIKEDHQTVASTQTTGPATSLSKASRGNSAVTESAEATASSRSEINEVAGTSIRVRNELTATSLSETSQGKAVIESAESTVSSQPDDETPSEINEVEKISIRGSRPSTNVMQNVGSFGRLIPNGLRNNTPAVHMSSDLLKKNQIASCAAETNSKSEQLHNELKNQQREQDTTEKRTCLPSDSCQLTKDSFDRNNTREPASLNNASGRILQSTNVNGVEKPLYTLSSSLNTKTHEVVSVSEVHPTVSVTKVHPSANRAVFPGFIESGQAAPQTSNSGSKKDEDDVIFVPPSGSVVIDLDSDTEENSKNKGELGAGNALDQKPITLDTSTPSSSLQDSSEMPAVSASSNSDSQINNTAGLTNSVSQINNRAGLTNSDSLINNRAGLTNSDSQINNTAGLTNSDSQINNRAGLTNSDSQINNRAGLTNSDSQINNTAGLTNSVSQINNRAGLTNSDSLINNRAGLTNSDSLINNRAGLTNSVSQINNRAGLTNSDSQINNTAGLTNSVSQINNRAGLTNSDSLINNRAGLTNSDSLINNRAGLTNSVSQINNRAGLTNSDSQINNTAGLTNSVSQINNRAGLTNSDSLINNRAGLTNSDSLINNRAGLTNSVSQINNRAGLTNSDSQINNTAGLTNSVSQINNRAGLTNSDSQINNTAGLTNSVSQINNRAGLTNSDSLINNRAGLTNSDSLINNRAGLTNSVSQINNRAGLTNSDSQINNTAGLTNSVSQINNRAGLTNSDSLINNRAGLTNSDSLINNRAGLTNSVSQINNRAGLTNSDSQINNTAGLTNSVSQINNRAGLTNSDSLINNRAGLTNSDSQINNTAGLTNSDSQINNRAGLTNSDSQINNRAGLTNSDSQINNTAGLTNSVSQINNRAGLTNSDSLINNRAGLTNSVSQINNRAGLTNSDSQINNRAGLTNSDSLINNRAGLTNSDSLINNRAGLTNSDSLINNRAGLTNSDSQINNRAEPNNSVSQINNRAGPNNSVSQINNSAGPTNSVSQINNSAGPSISEVITSCENLEVEATGVIGSVCDDDEPFDLEFEYQRRLAEIKKENSCKRINYESDDSDTSDDVIIIENCSTVYDVEGSESTDLDDEPLSKRLCTLLQSSVGTVRKVKKKRHSKRHHKNNRENELSKYQIVTRSRSRKLRTDTEEY